ncbi:MAG: PEP/pyruvate-binding domain-containing protein [Thermoproteota archaeon]
MPSKSFIVDLKNVCGRDWEKVGGKAANLGELKRLGFPVPKGFVLTTGAYEDFLSLNGLEAIIESSLARINPADLDSIEECSRRIREAVEHSSLPAELAEDLRRSYEDLRVKSVAVRSSATVEDLPKESFAGQLETFLNVKGFKNVERCIIQCYASLWGSRAIAYRERNRVPHLGLKMAVIVQTMVPAKSAGVLFTVNPVSSDSLQMIVESNFGLGETVVSGGAMPDRFVILRDLREGRESLKIVSREIGTKNYVAKPSSKVETGVEHVETPFEERFQPSLSEENVLRLAEIGLAIEKGFGCPQDIEWAVDEDNNILILQSRPVTSLAQLALEDEVVWSRGYSDDYWNDPVTPLFFELLGDQLTNIVNVELNKIMGYSQPGSKKTDQLLKLHHAHAYFNLEVLKQKVEYEIPPFLRNEDILNYFPDGSGPYGKETIKKLSFRLRKRIMAELRVMFHDPKGSVTRTASAYEEWTQKVFNPFWEQFEPRMSRMSGGASIRDYVEFAEELDELMVGHFRLVRYGIPVHNIGMNLLAQYLLKRFLGEEEALKTYPVLISGLEHKTSETNERISLLASVASSSPELKEIILETPSEKILEKIGFMNTPDAQGFMREFNRFLEGFGVRGFTREPYYPRWGEAPQYVFDILKPLVEEDRSIATVEPEGLKQEEAMRMVERRIRALRLGWFKWKIFSTILRFARRYIIFRENQRFNLDRWITMNRRIYLEIGKILKSRGVLQDPQEVFFLTKREIKRLASEQIAPDELVGVRLLVNNRKQEFLKYENTTPAKFIQGSREFNDPPPGFGMVFKGIPASQGILTAPVRVLKSIEDVWQVRTGEILVVPRTDPGWTPVFCKIGGLITETGGMLSHGAVVSREYGIPAVTNVQNACRVFKTGQTVTIDGNSGLIRVEGMA